MQCLGINVNVGHLMLISLTMIQFRKTAHGFNHAHHKKQNQQGVAHGLQPVVDVDNHGPYPAALEVLRAGGDQRPDLRQFVVPGGQCGVYPRPNLSTVCPSLPNCRIKLSIK